MDKRQITRAQHFVPRFILNRFFASTEFRLFDKRYGKSYSKTPGGSMYKKLFYEHDDFDPNEIEDLLASRENMYAPIIEKLIAQEKLTLEEHKTLIEFRHITYYRSNEFIGFHTYRKDRGLGSSHQRLDWLRINGIFDMQNNEKDIKKSQLKAIQEVINKTDAAYYLSSLTPICFVAVSSDKKFVIGDNGSISIGGESEGMAVIVISPFHALAFPKVKSAAELMKKIGATSQESNIIYLGVKNDIVAGINEKVIDRAFEYYIEAS